MPDWWTDYLLSQELNIPLLEIDNLPSWRVSQLWEIVALRNEVRDG